MGWYGLDFNRDGEISFVEHVLSEDILGNSSCGKRRRDSDDTDRELDDFFLRDDSEDSCSDFDSW